MNTTRFTSAANRSISELGRELDRFFFADPSSFGVIVTSPSEIRGRSVAMLRIAGRMKTGERGHAGLVVQVKGNVASRGSQSNDVPANAVVTDLLPNGDLLYADDAYVWIALDPQGDAGIKELYLSDNGLVRTTQPSSGLVQKVGRAVAYDGETRQFLCHIAPQPAHYGAVVSE
ncbi:MAG: hypothetical protein ABFD89_12135 [Bryobacteraceae bacterium]